jgi:hypothetical protein
MRVFLAVLILVSTAAADPKPMKLGANQKLTFADFWEVGGITKSDTAESIKTKFGEPKQVSHRDGTTLRYQPVSISFRDDKAIQLDFALYTDEDRAALPQFGGGPLALLGMTCDEAAKHLAFTKKVGSYTSCKHYDKNGTMLDITLMCTKTVTGLTVVWVPIPSDVKVGTPDHC